MNELTQAYKITLVSKAVDFKEAGSMEGYLNSQEGSYLDFAWQQLVDTIESCKQPTEALDIVKKIVENLDY